MEVFLVLFFSLVGLPDSGSFGKKGDTKVTWADFQTWNIFRKHEAMGAAALGLEQLLTTHMRENFVNTKINFFYHFLFKELTDSEVALIFFLSAV